MTVLTSVPDVGEGPNVLEHVGAVLALDILHHHEVVLLGPEVFYSTNTCSTWNLQIQYCDFLCAQMIHHIPDIWHIYWFRLWLQLAILFLLSARGPGVQAGEGVRVQCVEYDVIGLVQGGIGLVNKFMRYIGLTSGTRSPPRCTSYSRRTEGAWRWFIDSSSGYCCQTQAFLPACQWISGSSCRCSPHTGWWQRDMRPIMLWQKSVSRRLSRAEIRSQEVVRHQIPYK